MAQHARWFISMRIIRSDAYYQALLQNKINGYRTPINYCEERNMEKKELFFSVELKSKVNLKNVTMTNGDHENVLVEGSIGQLQYAAFSDGVVLEVFGDKGVFRINLTQDEIKKKEKQEKEAKAL
jgi:hypothetical protein